MIKEGYLKTPRLIKAFQAVKRVDFLPDSLASGAGGRAELEKLAEMNEALPIGFGQTISQPLVVAFMLELLDPRPGDKILDVGSGSGWTTAILSHIAGAGKPPGKVIAIERVPELKEFGKKNVSKYSFVEKGIAEFAAGDGSLGCEKEAPFDRILASASAQAWPQAWIDQLRIGGTIVAPIEYSIWRFRKVSKIKVEKDEYPGFVFVPLIAGKTEEKRE